MADTVRDIMERMVPDLKDLEAHRIFSEVYSFLCYLPSSGGSEVHRQAAWALWIPNQESSTWQTRFSESNWIWNESGETQGHSQVEIMYGRTPSFLSSFLNL